MTDQPAVPDSVTELLLLLASLRRLEAVRIGDRSNVERLEILTIRVRHDTGYGARALERAAQAATTALQPVEDTPG